MGRLGFRCRWWRGGLGLNRLALARGLGFIGLAASLGLVGFDLGLDSLLGVEIVLLFLALSRGFLDLFLACEFFLDVLCLLGRLQSDLLYS